MSHILSAWTTDSCILNVKSPNLQIKPGAISFFHLHVRWTVATKHETMQQVGFHKTRAHLGHFTFHSGLDSALFAVE